jgi:hypothetical protein
MPIEEDYCEAVIVITVARIVLDSPVIRDQSVIGWSATASTSRKAVIANLS